MDVISLYQKNIKSVVAPLGTAFTEEQLKLSWRYTDKPTIMFDGDDAGKRASFKAAIMSLPFLIPNKSIQFVTLPNNTDPDNYLKSNKFNELLTLLKNPSKSDFASIKEFLTLIEAPWMGPLTLNIFPKIQA